MPEPLKRRPPYVPSEKDRNTVRVMASIGVNQDKIVTMLGIAPKTLRKYFRRELDTGAIEANAKMAQTLYNKGLAGDTIAMIFWLKVRDGWKEPPQDHQLSGVNGGALAIEYSWAPEPVKKGDAP